MSRREHAEAIRSVYPKALAKLFGVTRSLADAEDALHDAVERALRTWAQTGGTVVGLSIDEIAQAFVVAPRTMEQRLIRARQRLRETGDVDGATPEGGRERIGAVLRTIHLLFNDGYWSGSKDAPIRSDLCRRPREPRFRARQGEGSRSRSRAPRRV